MAFLRFIILQVILCAGLVAAWMAGPLQHAFAGDSLWFVMGVLVVASAGLTLVAFGRLTDAAMVQDMLPIIAVIAMQGGILVALGVIGQALASGADPAKAVGGFFGYISIALYVSIAALSSYLWLKLTLWLTHGE